MKTVVLALLVVAVKVHAVPKDVSKEGKIFNECLAENDIKEEEFEKLAMKDDPKLHCLIACIYGKKGLLKNGKLNEDEMVKSLLRELKGPKGQNITEETLYEVIDECNEIADGITDVCDLINSLTLCMRDLLDKEDVHKD